MCQATRRHRQCDGESPPPGLQYVETLQVLYATSSLAPSNGDVAAASTQKRDLEPSRQLPENRVQAISFIRRSQVFAILSARTRD